MHTCCAHRLLPLLGGVSHNRYGSSREYCGAPPAEGLGGAPAPAPALAPDNHPCCWRKCEAPGSLPCQVTVGINTQEHVYSAEGVQHHFCDEVQRQINDDISRGIVPKKDGKPHRMTDFQKLNQACLHETNYTKPPFDLIIGVPKHTYKTDGDVFSWYHQIPLDEESCKLITFIAPWDSSATVGPPWGTVEHRMPSLSVWMIS